MTETEALAYFSEWKKAYQLAFGKGDNPAFADLAAFCFERKSCVVRGDRDQSFVLEGRREVILRIRNFLDLTPEELVALYTTRPAQGATSHDGHDPAISPTASPATAG